MPAVTLYSPAKLNLFLAVVGRRGDGYHDLVSLAAPLDFGDTLTAETNRDGRFELHCDDPALAVDESNLVLRAAHRFRAAVNGSHGVTFSLQKRIPQGAGLGGGSSNATATLLALNHLEGSPLRKQQLAELAEQLGSDCPLFLESGPVVMRGRGERLEPVPPQVVPRISGRRVLLFKPSFAVSTPWSYRQLAARQPSRYLPSAEAEARLTAWMDAPDAPLEDLLFNTLESVAFEKFVALPVLLKRLSEQFGVQARMSGSGSTCFLLLPPKPDPEKESAVKRVIQEAWGERAFLVETGHRVNSQT